MDTVGRYDRTDKHKLSTQRGEGGKGGMQQSGGENVGVPEVGRYDRASSIVREGEREVPVENWGNWDGR